MKAEETKKLDAMMEIPPATKTKGKKKKKASKAQQPSEPEEPPPQDELPISLPATPSGPGMRIIYPDRQIPKEEVVTQVTTTDEDKGAESTADHTHMEEREAGDGEKREEEGESESEEEEESGDEREDGKKEEEAAAKKKPPQEKKETATDLISDTYNGAVMENYKWSQTMTDIDVRVPIAPGTRPKDVAVEIKNDHLKVMLHKPEKKVRNIHHLVIAK